jgi:methyl-accepting chemotaxis protein
MNLSRLKIGPRVALAFGAVVLTILAMAAVISLALARYAANAEQARTGIERQQQSAQMLLLAKDNAIDSLVMLVSSSPELQARLKREMAERDTRIVSNLQALEALSSDDEMAAAQVAEARKRQSTYTAGVKRIVDLVQAGKQAEATFAADEEMIPMLAPFLGALGQLNALEVGRVNQAQLANLSLIQSIEWLTGAAAVTAVLLAVTAGVLIVRSITGQLGGEPAQAVETARAIASGDLSRRFQVKPGTEGSLMHALSEMQVSLMALVGRVRSASEIVATASTEIAQGNLDLSSRTEEQASALQQSAASMDQLATTMRQTAESAKRGNSLAADASRVAAQGGEAVSGVVNTMKHINDSSRRIADIIGVIDGIAFQTNILALNAAVEAARAGEQGRGFAVVASEVRSLAQRSADAAKEIKSLISASVERAEQGSAMVDQAGATMEKVVSSIQRVADIMSEISAATEQQDAGVSQVSQAVAEMDRATQQNAALVEQGAASAESLRTQSQSLVTAVSVFRLGGA